MYYNKFEGMVLITKKGQPWAKLIQRFYFAKCFGVTFKSTFGIKKRSVAFTVSLFKLFYFCVTMTEVKEAEFVIVPFS